MEEAEPRNNKCVPFISRDEAGERRLNLGWLPKFASSLNARIQVLELEPQIGTRTMSFCGPAFSRTSFLFYNQADNEL